MIKTIAPVFVIVLLAGCLGRGGRPDTRPGGTNETVLATTTTTVAVPAVTPLIDQYMAEQVYSDAVNLVYDGYYDEAIVKLKSLVDRRVIDRYVFETLLELYITKADQFRMQNNMTKLAATLKEARVFSEQALTYYSNDLKLMQIYADIVRAAGDMNAFVDALGKILAVYPNDTFGNYYFGIYYYLSGKYDKAYPYLVNVLVHASPSTEFDYKALYDAYYYLGMIEIQNGNYSDAIAYLERVKSFGGLNLDLVKTLAVLYSQLLYFGEAETNFSEIPSNMLTKDVAEPYIGVMLVNDSPGLNEVASDFYYESAFAKAVKLYLKGDYTNAMFQLARVQDSSYVTYYVHYLKYLIYSNGLVDNEGRMKEAFMLGSIAKELGNHAVAIYYYRIVEDYTNAIPDIYWLIGSLYDDSGDVTNAIRYYERYLGYSDALDYQTAARIRLAYMYYSANRMQDSVRQVELAKEAAKNADERYMVYFYSGLMNFELKKYRDSLTDFNTALSNRPDLYDLYYYIASVHAQLEEYDPAIDLLLKARAKNPNSPEVNNLLAYLYAVKKTELDQALELVKLALLKDPDNLAYLDTLGWVYYQRAEYDKSFEVYLSLERTVEGQPDVAGLDEIYYHIGMVYEKKGNGAEAVRYYKLGLEANPQNALIRTRLNDLNVR